MTREPLTNLLLCQHSDALDLAVDEHVEPSNQVAAEVILSSQLAVEHGQNTVAELIHLAIYQLLAGLGVNRGEPLSAEHLTDLLCDRSDSLIKHLEQFPEHGQVLFHVHAVFVTLGLVAIVDVKHLDEGRAVDSLLAILKNWDVT